MRVFDVALQNIVVQADLDVVAATGSAYTALVLKYNTTVHGNDRRIRFDLLQKVENPFISAVEIIRALNDDENDDFLAEDNDVDEDFRLGTYHYNSYPQPLRPW